MTVTSTRDQQTANDPKKQVTVIFNPVSGCSDPEDRKAQIAEALERHGYSCDFVVTDATHGACEAAKEAICAGVDLLVVAGGDGTIMETLEAAAGTGIPVAVVPSGTGNLLSLNLGVPTEVHEAVNVALLGEPLTLDLIRTNFGRTFAIMGGLGLDAEMIRDADRRMKRRFGAVAYLWAAIKNLPRRRAAVQIWLDDRPPFVRRFNTVLIANMGKLTGGIEAMPSASPVDGRLDVALVTAESLRHWLRLLVHILTGRAANSPDIAVYQARRVRIRTKRPQAVEFDGENAGTHHDWEAYVDPAAVRIMLPPGAPAVANTPRPSQPQERNRAWHFSAILASASCIIGLVLWLSHRKR